MTFPQAELERRGPVWAALSELYLDTELRPEDYRRICGVILASGYTDDEIEFILRRELGPVLGPNLRSAAGEWAGFDQPRLVAAILKHRTSWRRFLPRLGAHRLIEGHWRAIRDLVRAGRNG